MLCGSLAHFPRGELRQVFLVDPLTDTVLKRHRMKRPGPKHRVQSLHLCNSSGALSPLPRAELVQGHVPPHLPVRALSLSLCVCLCLSLSFSSALFAFFPSASGSRTCVFNPDHSPPTDRKQLLRDGEAPWNQPIRFSDVSFPCSSAFELVLGLKESQVFPCEELSAEVCVGGLSYLFPFFSIEVGHRHDRTSSAPALLFRVVFPFPCF